MSAPAITQASKLEDFPKNPTVRDYFKAAIGDKVKDIFARMKARNIMTYYASIIRNIKINLGLKDEESLSAEDRQGIIDELIRLFEDSDSEIGKFNEFARRVHSNKNPQKNLDEILAEVMGVKVKEYTGKECFADAFKGVKNGPFNHNARKPRIEEAYMHHILNAVKKELGIEKIVGQDNHDLVTDKLQKLYKDLESSVDKLNQFGRFLRGSTEEKRAFSLDQLVNEFGKPKEKEEERYPTHKYFLEAFSDGEVKAKYQSIKITETDSNGDIHSITVDRNDYSRLVSKIKTGLLIIGDGYNKRIGEEIKAIRSQCKTLEEFGDRCADARRQYRAERTKKRLLSSEDPLPPEEELELAMSDGSGLVLPAALSAPISNRQSHPLAGSGSLEVAPSDNPCPSAPSPKPSFAGGLNDDFDNVDLGDLDSFFDHKGGLTTHSPIESPTPDDGRKRSSPSSSFSAQEHERLARRARTEAYSPSLDY